MIDAGLNLGGMEKSAREIALQAFADSQDPMKGFSDKGHFVSEAPPLEVQQKITLSNDKFLCMSVDGLVHVYNKNGNGMGLSLKTEELHQLIDFLQKARTYLITMESFVP